jgi:hypothetical protein
MTVLACNETYLAEFEAGMLTIARRQDGHCVAMRGKGVAGHFRDSVKGSGVDAAMGTFVRMGERLGGWRPLYKADAMPRLLGDAS